MGSWAGDKIVELSNKPLVVTGISVAVASLVSWKLAKCASSWNEDKQEELEEIIPKQSAATKVEEEEDEVILSPEDKWNRHTEEFCKKQSIPSVQSYYDPKVGYTERGWQTHRDPVNRTTRSTTATTSKLSTMSTSSMSPLRSTSPTKSAKKSTPRSS